METGTIKSMKSDQSFHNFSFSDNNEKEANILF